MDFKPNLKETVKRFQAFWNYEKVNRIPIRFRFPTGNLQANESYLSDSSSTITEGANSSPEKIEKTWEEIVVDPEKYLSYWEDQLSFYKDFPDDTIPTASTDLGPALIGGMIGIEIYFKNGTSWSEHPLEHNIDGFESYCYENDNNWVRYIENTTRYFLEQSKGRFAVGLANYMGPSDILTCLRGPTQVAMDFYEYPDQIKRITEACAHYHIEAVNHQLDLLPRYDGGTCEPYMHWTPGRGNWLTADVTSVLSPELYKEFLLPYDQMVVDNLDTCWMHVHSGSTFMVDSFLELKGLKGIQIVNDAPAGPSIKELLPVFKNIQKNHCLILRKFTIDEIYSVLSELKPNKLLVDTHCGSLEEARSQLDEWDENTKDL